MLKNDIDKMCKHVNKKLYLLRSIFLIFNSASYVITLLYRDERKYKSMLEIISQSIDEDFNPLSLLKAVKNCNLELIAELATDIVILSLAYLRSGMYGDALRKIREKLNNTNQIILKELNTIQEKYPIEEALCYINIYLQFIDEVLGVKKYLFCTGNVSLIEFERTYLR